MNKKLVFTVLGCTIVAGIGSAIYRSTFTRNTTPLFKSEQPITKDITQEITVTGTVQIKDRSRIGSLVPGIVKDILVAENDHVQEGQLLALLDNGKADTLIRATKGRLLQAQAHHEYAHAVYTREKELFDAGHRSSQEIEAIKKNLAVAHGALITAQAEHDAAVIEFENTQIKSPDNGIIIKIGVRPGVKVTTDLDATVLFEVARDISKMEAELLIEESDVCHVEPGHKVSFTVDSYPFKTFNATIKSVSYAPVKTNNELSYRATMIVDNSSLLLRPGMTIHAKIKVKTAQQALCIDAQAFYLSPDAIKDVACKLGYQLTMLPADEKKKLAQTSNDTKTIWIKTDNAFVERLVSVGSHDIYHHQICNGITPDEHYLVDVVETSNMDQLYKKMFRGAL